MDANAPIPSRSDGDSGPSPPILAKLSRMLVAERMLTQRIHRDAADFMHPDTLMLAAGALGMLRGNRTIVGRDDNEITVLFDHALHACRFEGATAVEAFAATRPYALSSGRDRLLAAMLRTRYTILEPIRNYPEVGCIVRDLFWGDVRFLCDRSLGTTWRKPIPILVRTFDFDAHLMA